MKGESELCCSIHNMCLVYCELYSIKLISCFFGLLSCCCGDPGLPQWMVSGMSGPAGAPALPPVLMGPCREPESAMAPHTEALSAEASGWRLLNASLESVQVREPGSHF